MPELEEDPETRFNDALNRFSSEADTAYAEKDVKENAFESFQELPGERKGEVFDRVINAIHEQGSPAPERAAGFIEHLAKEGGVEEREVIVDRSKDLKNAIEDALEEGKERESNEKALRSLKERINSAEEKEWKKISERMDKKI